MYGVSKCFGEAVASYFADEEGPSSIAVRIGYFAEPNTLRGAELGELRAFVSPRDLCDLLVRCIHLQVCCATSVSSPHGTYLPSGVRWREGGAMAIWAVFLVFASSAAVKAGVPFESQVATALTLVSLAALLLRKHPHL